MGSPVQSARSRTPHVDNRLPTLLDAAATQFAAKGFQGASIRDIVRAVGMLPGSLYYHFANKEELLLAVYAEGVRRIDSAVAEAVSRQCEPWARLEAACVAHLESLLDQSAYAKVVVSVHPRDTSAVADALTVLRDSYERKFVALVSALQLPDEADHKTMRMLLLGALNWTPVWYRPNGASPEQLAREYVGMLERTAGVANRDVGRSGTTKGKRPKQKAR